MTFDVIITTYNRPDSLKLLVQQILQNSILPQHIIIVDSSKEINNDIQEYEKVIYIHSSHGNQPYQRYIGYLTSKAEFIIFFDDDMRIEDRDALKKILDLYSNPNIVGVQPNFINTNDFLSQKIPKSKFATVSKFNKVIKYIKSLSGYYTPSKGQLSYCGIRGVKPKNLEEVLYFNGGVFSCKRSYIFKNFNFKLFDIFEDKLGMGEDTILGHTLSKEGKILYVEKPMFLHDDQKDSTYTVDFRSYGKRVAYSRLYLSYEYIRLNDKSKLLAFLHFNWYIFWRIFGMIVNQVLDYKYERKEILIGYIQGYFLALKDTDKLSLFDDGDYWKKEALYDIDK